MSNVLGSGWWFPYDAKTGGIDPAVEVDSVESAVRMVLATPIGSRFMNPEYGSQLHQLVFDPLDDETAALAEVYAREAILRWVPRIVEVFISGRLAPDEHLILLDVSYRCADSPQRRMMVYPFYLQPQQ